MMTLKATPPRLHDPALKCRMILAYFEARRKRGERLPSVAEIAQATRISSGRVQELLGELVENHRLEIVEGRAQRRYRLRN